MAEPPQTGATASTKADEGPKRYRVGRLECSGWQLARTCLWLLGGWFIMGLTIPAVWSVVPRVFRELDADNVAIIVLVTIPAVLALARLTKPGSGAPSSCLAVSNRRVFDRSRGSATLQTTLC